METTQAKMKCLTRSYTKTNIKRFLKLMEFNSQLHKLEGKCDSLLQQMMKGQLSQSIFCLCSPVIVGT